MRSSNAHLVEEVLISFGIRVDPWTMECKDAIDKVERAFEQVRQDGFDEGFDEGQLEADHTNHDDTYDEGFEDGRNDATLYDVVGNYLAKNRGTYILTVTDIVTTSSEDVEIAFFYTDRSGVQRNERIELSITDLIWELL